MAMIAFRSAAWAGRTRVLVVPPDVTWLPCHTRRAATQGFISARTCQTWGMTAMTAISSTDDAPAGLHEPCVLLKLGEIVLKGKNRQQFERLLQNNIRLAVADLGVDVRLWQRDGVIVLNPVPAARRTAQVSAPAGAVRRSDEAAGSGAPGESAQADIDPQAAADLIAQRMLDVMGVVRVCRAVRVAKQAQAAIDTAAELAGGRPGSFAVRARRRDKRFPV